MPTLYNHIKTLLGEIPPHIDFVVASFALEIIPKKNFLLRESEICKHLYFIETGAIQLFQINEKGEEKTIDILLAGEWFTDLPSFQNQMPSSLFVRTINHCHLQKINFNTFQELSIKAPKFMEGYIKIIEQKYQNMQARLQAFHTLKSLERIEWVIKNKPNLIQECPDKLVASYLGITKETYCRQKATLALIDIYQP